MNNCESPRIPLEILVSEISIEAGGPYEVIEGNAQEISATVYAFPDKNNFSIEWLDAAGTVFDFDQLTTIVTPSEPTYYTVIATSNGCIDEKEIIVDLIYQIDPTKVFSPNGDGRNDSWYIGDIDKYPNATLTIYNRWGTEVYQSRGYDNNWQGTWKGGNTLPMATYYYVINLNGDDNQVVTGSVTIVR